MKTFEQITAEMKAAGMKIPVRRVYFSIPDARNTLWNALSMFVQQEQCKAEWLPEYDRVTEWLSGNEGRGLLLFGNCGRGKSLLCRYVIPALFLQHIGKVVSVFDVQEMNRDIDTVLSRHIISLDDIGTEEISVKYGEKRLAFAEIMDAAEKYGKLVIVSTNLSQEELRQRYGDRVIDRIRATMLRVPFNGRSLRQ